MFEVTGSKGPHHQVDLVDGAFLHDQQLVKGLCGFAHFVVGADLHLAGKVGTLLGLKHGFAQSLQRAGDAHDFPADDGHQEQGGNQAQGGELCGQFPVFFL